MYQVQVPETRQASDGSPSYRPAEAVHLGGDRYRLIGTMPDSQQWRFTPGQVVYCETREGENGHIELVAVGVVSPLL